MTRCVADANEERSAVILDILANRGECELDELAVLCPRLGWHQMFLHVDYLSRVGKVRLKAKGAGIYVVSLASNLARTGSRVG